MNLEELPLARQIDYVFRQLEDELTNAVAGTVTIHIRNNAIGKYGIRHNPIEFRNGNAEQTERGLTAAQVMAFRQMAIDALRYKRSWTHGEIMYDFSVRPQAKSWSASVQYESNYNTANGMFRYQSPSKHKHLRETN